jgi:hypothetical protein
VPCSLVEVGRRFRVIALMIGAVSTSEIRLHGATCHQTAIFTLVAENMKSHHLGLIPGRDSNFSLRHYKAEATPTFAVFIIPVLLCDTTRPSDTPPRLTRE